MHGGSNVSRFREIVRVLAFYGFGYLIDSKLNKEQKSPENLRKAFEELGPTFIKIGQILSTRPDIMSTPYIEELSKLQDNVPPESFEAINAVFCEEFSRTVDDTFSYFNKTPLASASIAQVYTATLTNGQEVIVKIQRPRIEKKMRQDIAILGRILNLTKSHFSDAFINPQEALQELLSTTELELNFENEANNIRKFKELNSNIACVYSPFLIDSLCTKKVLTMEKINGFKIDDKKKLDAGGYEQEDLGRKLALCYFKQVFTDGFFHGDPHPGNIFISGGQICFLDFGIMGSFNSSLKVAMNEAIVSVALKDPNKLLKVILSIAIRKGIVNKNILYEDILYLFDSYLYTSLQNIKISILLQEIFDMCRRNNLQMPKDFVILSRSVVIIEGVVAKISPDMKILDIAVPFVKSNNKDAFLKALNLNEILLHSYGFVRDSSVLPTKILELTDSLINGRAKIQLQLSDLNKPVNEVNKMMNRLVFGLIVASMIISSSTILTSNVGPKLYEMSIIGITGYALSAVMALWLLISIIKSGKM